MNSIVYMFQLYMQNNNIPYKCTIKQKSKKSKRKPRDECSSRNTDVIHTDVVAFNSDLESSEAEVDRATGEHVIEMNSSSSDDEHHVTASSAVDTDTVEFYLSQMAIRAEHRKHGNVRGAGSTGRTRPDEHAQSRGRRGDQSGRDHGRLKGKREAQMDSSSDSQQSEDCTLGHEKQAKKAGNKKDKKGKAAKTDKINNDSDNDASEKSGSASKKRRSIFSFFKKKDKTGILESYSNDVTETEVQTIGVQARVGSGGRGQIKTKSRYRENAISDDSVDVEPEDTHTAMSQTDVGSRKNRPKAMSKDKCDDDPYKGQGIEKTKRKQRSADSSKHRPHRKNSDHSDTNSDTNNTSETKLKRKQNGNRKCDTPSEDRHGVRVILSGSTPVEVTSLADGADDRSADSGDEDNQRVRPRLVYDLACNRTT